MPVPTTPPGPTGSAGPRGATGSAAPTAPTGPAAPAAPAGLEDPTTPADPAAVRPTPYDVFGGAETFRRLVTRFYEGVARDEVLRAMYPEEDLGPAAERLRLFLEQYWGGPSTYGELRGHPRLRLRHAPFAIDEDARDRWLRHMRDAVDSLGLAPRAHAALWDYLERAAHAMVNQPGAAPGKVVGRA